MIIGFGNKARQGKDTCCSAILHHYERQRETELNTHGIRFSRVPQFSQVNFADALKQEVKAAYFNASDAYWSKPVSRFLRRVDVQESGCWLWKGCRNDRGYGLVRTSAKFCKAHRFMWERVLGLDSVDLLKHSCDVRNCVNPLHLSPGSPADNAADMVNRGRSRRGEGHQRATISDATVDEIRELAAQGVRNCDICKQVALLPGTVSRIVNYTRRAPYDAIAAPLVVQPFSDLWLTDEHKFKFVRTLQHYGTDYRRAQNPDYWVERYIEEVQKHRDVVLTSDMRFKNEADAVKYMKGVTVNVTRLNSDGSVYVDSSRPKEHISETELDNFGWDFYLKAVNGQIGLLEQQAIGLAEYLTDWRANGNY